MKLSTALILLLIMILPVFAEDPVINVLCYHRFKESKSVKDIYSITPELFTKHMQFLKDNGYNVVPMSQYVDYIDGKGKMPEKAVVITMDDGYKSVYEIAYPILKKFGYTGVSYVYESFFPGGKNAITTDMLKEMAGDGFELGCHSYTHPILTKRSAEPDDAIYANWLKKEIITPKKYLEEKTGLKVETMAYPFGAYSYAVTNTVKAAGYRAAFSVVPSYNTLDTDRFCLKRTMIFSSTSVKKLKQILEKKPIKLTQMQPPEASINSEGPPELKAVIAEDSLLNTATIKFKMGNVALDESVYDPSSRTLTYDYKIKPLEKGFHYARVCATGKDGAEYEYAWAFIVGAPVSMEALAK